MATLLRRLLSALASAVPAGIPVPVIAGPLAGAKWYSGAAAGNGKGLSVCFGLCEPQQLKAGVELSKGSKICFDIGANVGLYSLLFSRNAESVYAFEPLPRNLAWLYRGLSKNRVSNVTIVPAAVGSTVCIVSFEQGENCASARIGSSGIPIPCITIDAIAEHVGMPDVIKIDVEGAELSVLQGARNVLVSRRPAILLSTHSDSIKQNCLDYLSAFGYGSHTLNIEGNELICSPSNPDHSVSPAFSVRPSQPAIR